MRLSPAVTGRHFGWVFNHWWHNQPGFLWGWDETLPVPHSHEKMFRMGVRLLQAPSSWTRGGHTCLLTTLVGSHSLDGVSEACLPWKECDFIPLPVHAQSLQSCPTLCDPMDYSPPGSSVCGLSQARILEWVAISFSKGSSRPRDRTHVSLVFCIAGRFFSAEP